jgi:NTP pyrophosphatase (non-canonical NTP hydrolase)
MSDQKLLFGLMKSGEEGTELAQVLFKIINLIDEFEMDEDGNELYEKLVEEFGDVLASTTFVIANASEHFVSRITERAKFKINKYNERFNED